MDALITLPRRARTAPLRGRRRIVVVGNPNTGKTSLFNQLAGTRHRVGNYPGVTVEGATSEVIVSDDVTIDLVDLPGTYSLSARSAEERIAVDGLLGWEGHPVPDAALVVIDSTAIERNLYLLLQVAELDVPCVLALNMADEARSRGVTIDVASLRDRFRIPVVPVSARTGEGVAALKEALALAAGFPDRARCPLRSEFPAGVLAAADALGEQPLEGLPVPGGRPSATRGVAFWALASIDGDDELALPSETRRRVLEAQRRLAGLGVDIDHDLAAARWSLVDRLVAETVRRTADGRAPVTERLDSVLVHPVWGFVIFLALMGLLFQALFSGAEPMISAVEWVFGQLGEATRALLPPGLATSFIAEALIGGVGSVLVFLPQIVLLFSLMGLMEDSGYMARVAYLMDRIMRSVGLHGRAFVPMLSGFACAVPAILATRTMERRRDRLLTMLVVPLMTCSARLPVYTLVIASMLSGQEVFGLRVEGLLMVGLYVFSTVIALIAAAVLGRTLVKGERVPLILELPTYRMPRASTVARSVVDKAGAFLREAGTVILLCTVVLWAALHVPQVEVPPGTGEREAIKLQAEGSIAGSVGRMLEPAIAPLGYDWRIGVGLVGAFAAREVFVATLGVVYGAGEGADEQNVTLRERLRAEKGPDGRPKYGPAVGLSLLVFFALSAQCTSTLAAVKRETGGWRWPIFLFSYMTVLAWVGAFLAYRLGLVIFPN